MFKRVMGSHQLRSSAGNIFVTLAGKHLLVWITSKLTNESILGRNRTNVPAARNGFKGRQTLIAISKYTTSELLNAPSLVVHVAKRFTTSRPTTLMFAPRIQLQSPLSNDPPLRKTQTRLLQKNLRGGIKQVSLQNHQPLPNNRLQLQVLAGKWIHC